ncbi:MAG: hypothetical protein CM1200mP18_07220 [Gammaproteobacteria bacterium]|nr:MAG: hypothetical protein CM1200mP18_07220 [Gammaproteobacteria bacterium]
MNFQLSDAAYSFIRGHRLRIAISTTYWPMIGPFPPEPVELTLHTHNSSMSCPLDPGEAGQIWAPFLSAEEGPPMPATILSAGASENRVSRDVLSGRVEVLSERGGDRVLIEEHGLEGENENCRANVN